MPRRKFALINTRMVQTTPNVQFRQGKMASNPGSNPNPLIGWRKELSCDCPNLLWQEIFKNNCCEPIIRSIQNKNGVIDASYSYTTQGYFQQKCSTYEQNAFNFDISNNVLHPFCCANNCSAHNVAVYKRKNSQFPNQSVTNGAVSMRARLNRLKYNTIVSSMPAGEIYWGGQTANKNILQCKTKNKCFCTPGCVAPCKGQNLFCRLKN